MWAGVAQPTQTSASIRDVVGFVTTGGFSLHRGAGWGLGYVHLATLLTLLAAEIEGADGHASAGHAGAPDGVLVLVRNTSSTQFRPAMLSAL